MGLIKIKKRAFSSATNEVRRSRKRVLIASAMRKQPQSPNEARKDTVETLMLMCRRTYICHRIVL